MVFAHALAVFDKASIILSVILLSLAPLWPALFGLDSLLYKSSLAAHCRAGRACGFAKLIAGVARHRHGHLFGGAGRSRYWPRGKVADAHPRHILRRSVGESTEHAAYSGYPARWRRYAFLSDYQYHRNVGRRGRYFFWRSTP